MKNTIRITLLFCFALCAWFCKPKKEVFTSDASIILAFSTDTVFFDTVFTSTGTVAVKNVTKRLRVFNTSDKAISIAEIKLAGQNESNYDIYVNGINAKTFNNTDLLGKDSLYVLVQLKIDDQNKNLPYIVEDSILFNTNGNLQKVRLIAWGQDAIYFRTDSISANTAWSEGKPYVIFDNLKVKEGVTLSLAPGTKVVFGNNASMSVDGTINSTGTFEKQVSFIQYRKGRNYDEGPGQWKGIAFSEKSTSNTFKWTNIKNAAKGLDFQKSKGQNNIQNCQVANMSDVAVNSNATSVSVTNTLLTNAANYLFYAEGGGNIEIYNSTVTNSSSDFFRSTPSVTIDDKKAGNTWSVNLTNNIVWGSLSSELVVNLPESITPTISYNLIKTNNRQFGNSNNIVNVTSTFSIFSNPTDRDFTLKEASPAINKGLVITGITDQPDLLNKTRDNQPDLGAYEFFQE